MSKFNALVFGVLFANAVIHNSAVSVHAAASEPVPYAPPPGHLHRNAEEKIFSENGEETKMRKAGGYGVYGAPSYGGPSYETGYGAGSATAHHYGGVSPVHSSHTMTYVSAHPKKPHSGLVITCQPNLAGYAHGLGGIGYGSSEAQAGYSGAKIYRSSSSYSRPYSHMSYEAPASHEYIQVYDNLPYDAPTYDAQPQAYDISGYKSAPYAAPAKHYYAQPSAKPISYSTASPGNGYSAFSYDAPAPNYNPPASSVSAYSPQAYPTQTAEYKSTSYSAPTPTYSAPAYGAASTSYAASSYSAQAPSYHVPKPSYSAPYSLPSAPTYGAPPSYVVAPSSKYRAANEDESELNNNNVIGDTKLTLKDMAN